MKIKNILLPSLALGMAVVFLAPATEVMAWTSWGTTLSTSQRHMRVYNNFSDAASNNNTTIHYNWPGFDGAELAIWKAYAEWGSELFGDGSGDPLQTVGSGGANFDPYMVGNATSIGAVSNNIVSAIGACSSGVLAYCEKSSSGWRIRFCDNAWNWQDGPGDDGNIDMQGVACHELGHSLGLGHSGSSNATMYAYMSGSGTSARSIEADDIAGVQGRYGVKSASKPTITGATFNGNWATITGYNFSTTGNDVWFARESASAAGSDPHLKVSGVSSNGGGTQIVVNRPTGSGPGNVLVQKNATGHASLSNGYPADVPGTPASATYRNGSGVNPNIFTYTSLPILGTNWTSEIDGGSVGASGLTFVVGYSGPFQFMTGVGELLIDVSTPWLMTSIAGGGSSISPHSIAIPSDPTLAGFPAYTQGFLNNLGGNGQLVNAIDLIIGY